MRYGIDLDGVCFDFLKAFLERANKKFNWTFTKEEITSYYWNKGTEVTDEEFWDEFHAFGRDSGYRHLELLPGTMDALDRIVNAGHEIFYITNRPEYARQDTIAALDEHEFPFRKNLFFAHGDKSSLINKLNIKVFVEDSGRTIEEVSENTTAYIYCVDYAHNRDVEHPQVERINDWDDFLLAEAI